MLISQGGKGMESPREWKNDIYTTYVGGRTLLSMLAKELFDVMSTFVLGK
jgi:hypothetical protein